MDGSLTDSFMSAALNGTIYFGLAVAGYVTLKSALFTVKQKNVTLITQFGKHVRTETEPGLHMKIPFIQKIAQNVSTAEFQVDEELETKTIDDLFVKLPISIHFEVVDAPIYHFNKGNPLQLMKKNVSAAVREYTSGKSFQDLYKERQEIRKGVLEKVDEKVKQFGIRINDIVIDEPQATQAVKSSFDRIRSSAADLETAKNESEKAKIMTVKEAEAARDRDLLRGEGAAGYRQKIFSQYAEQIQALVDKGTSREEAVQVMMEIMRLDTYREVGDKGNMVIVVPSSDNSGATKTLTDLTTFSKVLDRVGGRHAMEAKSSSGPTIH